VNLSSDEDEDELNFGSLNSSKPAELMDCSTDEESILEVPPDCALEQDLVLNTFFP
jgi:hypothetical protein